MMNRTLVNIITEDDPVPNYLFIKELYQQGDRLMFISAKDTEDDLDHVSSLFAVTESEIDEILLKSDLDELAWDKICRTIMAQLDQNRHYLVNVAGGTTLLAMAVHEVFARYSSEFYIVSQEKNLIVKANLDENISDNDEQFIPIAHRMTLEEYFAVHELQNSVDYPIHSEMMARHFYKLFTTEAFSSHDFYILNLLRIQYRNRKNTIISDAENRPKNINFKPITGLQQLLDKINYTPQKKDTLAREDVEYLTGGWFEEYVYFLIKKRVKPHDIAIGTHIWREGAKVRNELDVTFIKGNILFVVECKTGVDTHRMFNEIVYKACALKEVLLGINCHSYIFSFKEDKDGTLKKTAANMGITFCDNSCLLSTKKMKKITLEMTRLSNDDSR